MRRAGLIFAVPITVALIAASVYLLVHSKLEQPLVLHEATVIDVRPGSSLRGIAQMLANRHILSSPRTLAWYGQFSGKAGRIQAGEYELLPGTTAMELLDQLVSGRVRLHALTVIEGWTFQDMLDALHGHPAVEVTLKDASGPELVAKLDLEQEHPEGIFFPDTYRFSKHTTDVEILRQARARLIEELNTAWAGRTEDLPYETPYQALIMASIVEKETALDSERATIAGVFVRRLEKGMRLQTDPTVIYGMGDAFDGNIRRKDLETDTPYNTYTRRGLPPTPISLPGAASIRAVMHPTPGDSLFFVATGNGDGSHYFSSTLEEHQQAVRRYLDRRRAQQ